MRVRVRVRVRPPSCTPRHHSPSRADQAVHTALTLTLSLPDPQSATVMSSMASYRSVHATAAASPSTRLAWASGCEGLRQRSTRSIDSLVRWPVGLLAFGSGAGPGSGLAFGFGQGRGLCDCHPYHPYYLLPALFQRPPPMRLGVRNCLPACLAPST